MIAKPSRADRLVEKAERRKARRSSLVRNASGLALAKPETWHDAKYRAWAVAHNDCGIKGRKGHVCGRYVDGKLIKAPAHPEPFAKSIKAPDNTIVVLCELAHRLQHDMGWQSFQRKYAFNRDAEARRIFEASPWASRVEVVWK